MFNLLKKIKNKDYFYYDLDMEEEELFKDADPIVSSFSREKIKNPSIDLANQRLNQFVKNKEDGNSEKTNSVIDKKTTGGIEELEAVELELVQIFDEFSTRIFQIISEDTDRF